MPMSMPAQSRPSVSVRQTVQAGPIDANGFPSFLPASAAGLSITSQNVTASAALVVAAANGSDILGAVDRIGRSTANLTWAGLTDNATNYLYVDVSAAGVLTTGATTLAPVYKRGGARSVTNGQATFNIGEMWMTVGNGASAVQAWRVFVGEAVTAAGNVMSAIGYAYQGKSILVTANAAAPTSTNLNHNLGVVPWNISVSLECTTAEQGWSVGDELPVFPNGYDGSSFRCLSVGVTGRNTLTVATSSGSEWIVNKAGNTTPPITTANWRYKMYISRDW